MALDIRQHIEDWVKELEAEVGTVKTEIVEHVRQFGDWFSNKHQHGVAALPSPGEVEDEIKEFVAEAPEEALATHAALTVALIEAGHMPPQAPAPQAPAPQALTPPPVEDKATADTATEIKTNEGPEEHHDRGAP